MKAEPALPTVSAREVARLGEARVAEAAMPRAFAGVSLVSLPLRRVVGEGGVVKLVDESGRVCGICASEGVAVRTINFFR